MLSFSRCLSNIDYPYARLSDNEAAYGRLVAYLEEDGFTYMQYLDRAVSMDYVKSHDGTLPARAGFSTVFDTSASLQATTCLFPIPMSSGCVFLRCRAS
jgi:hypothetical protein